ncbi:MAG: hypothetical protein ACLQG3_13035, partial [Terracidiphilus sp.]
RLLWNVRAGTQNVDGMLMYYVPTISGGWKTFGDQFDSNWCCTGTGSEEYAKLVDTLYFHDDRSVYVNQFVASEVSWPEKHARLVQDTRFPEEERTSLTVHAEAPVSFGLRIRAPHWAERVTVTVNGQPQKAEKGSDGYLALERVWKNGDRIDVSLPMVLRQEPVAGSPELATLAYGPLVLAACQGRAGLSRDMIDGYEGPDMNRLPPLPMPEFNATSESHWAKKDDSVDLLFHTVGQSEKTDLKPLYQIVNERYSVYWKQSGKA